MSRVFVHVERVVLRGFGEADKRAALAGLDVVLRQMALDHDTLLRIDKGDRVPRLRLGVTGEVGAAPGEGWSAR